MSATRAHRIQDLSMCPCTGGTLDRLLQPAILAILASGPLHGYRLAERIGSLPGFTGPKPDVSGVYRFLKSMERKGLVVSTWSLSESGPAKKSYEITAAGRQCLREWVNTLAKYREGIGVLLKLARKAAGKSRLGN